MSVSERDFGSSIRSTKKRAPSASTAYGARRAIPGGLRSSAGLSRAALRLFVGAAMVWTLARWRCLGRLAPVRSGAGAGTGLPKKRRSGSLSRTWRRRPRTTANGGCAAGRALDSWRLRPFFLLLPQPGKSRSIATGRPVTAVDRVRSRIRRKRPLDARNGPGGLPLFFKPEYVLSVSRGRQRHRELSGEAAPCTQPKLRCRQGGNMIDLDRRTPTVGLAFWNALLYSLYQLRPARPVHDEARVKGNRSQARAYEGP